MTNTGLANIITRKLVSSLGDSLYGVLLYGSSISARKTPNDLDLIVVMRDRETPAVLKKIAQIIREYTEMLDIQVINLRDIDSETFAHDTHGQFFIPFVKSAKVLYGENPFLSANPSYSSLVVSVIQKSQYYYFRSKKMYTNSQYVVSEKECLFHRKKLLLMLCDVRLVITGCVLCYDSMCDLRQVIEYITGVAPDEREIDFLAGNTNDVDFDYVFSLYQKYYFSILDTLRVRVSTEDRYVGDVCIELHKRGSKTLWCILPGCPTDYREDIVQYLGVTKNDVAILHYSATGRSRGKDFLSPNQDANAAIGALSPEYDKIIVLANSYGGGAVFGLDASVVNMVERIICVSPVIAMSETSRVESLAQYLVNEQSHWYRFNSEIFHQYLMSTTRSAVVSPEKYVIFHGATDKEIPIHQVQEYANSQNIQLHVINDEGHLSLNKLLLTKIKLIWEEMNVLGLGYWIDNPVCKV